MPVTDMETIVRAAEVIVSARHMVALTGAGISQESDVPTFRGNDGLWRQYDPMELATPEAFKRDPGLVWEWYSWRQGLIANCRPNPAHTTLARWARDGLLKALITQNVDGLHERAGSEDVIEVHGNLWRVRCTECDYRAHLSAPASGVPECPECGALLRPDVVWFGEALDAAVLARVWQELHLADACIVIGTSAVVYPAAQFPATVKSQGGAVIEVNVEETPLTPIADVHVRGRAGEVLPAIDRAIAALRGQ